MAEGHCEDRAVSMRRNPDATSEKDAKRPAHDDALGIVYLEKPDLVGVRQALKNCRGTRTSRIVMFGNHDLSAHKHTRDPARWSVM